MGVLTLVGVAATQIHLGLPLSHPASDLIPTLIFSCCHISCVNSQSVWHCCWCAALTFALMTLLCRMAEWLPHQQPV